MRAALIALPLILSLAACAGGPVGNPRPPQPAKAVELDRYLGKWYEVARYDMKFQKGCEAVTADYSKRPDGMIRVLNTCRDGAVDGPVRTAEGKARVVDPTTNAKLKVSFFGPFWGDYWVMDHADDYSWSIVGEGSGQYLWLLSRKPPTDQDRQALTARARALGYDVTMLRPTKQPAP
ncbi:MULTISPECIES: lipocalin family protein [unclassified Caulobacter]|uniref:lipocalin family protein n=1 Tax=unclassified Caulobacter TaxID=2648921 RepID=UPI000D3B41C8|nr:MULTISPECIES: lipocalin family protein [unclassified Caulobacter]PTS82584.1 lipocalin [Caulobacter sp. HMWF009]PTT12253.1 lipocalin [Caulobacter sp. HMWF025]